MRKILIANWKLNPDELEEARDLAKATDIEGVVICPPIVFLEEVGSVLQKATLGSQDIFFKDEGAYTGEISPTQLKDLNVKYAIVGHSERRQYQNETDELINKKVKAALDTNITPVLCVGESLETHNEGLDATKAFIKHQLDTDLKGVEGELIVAYEPIWAIGKDKADDPEEAAQIIEYIKEEIGGDKKVIYGGSVDSKNVQSFLDQQNIDGFLVGGASLKLEEFNKIADIASSGA